MILRLPNSLFAQVTLLLAATLVLAQCVSLAILLSLPPPQPTVTPMATVADLLRRDDAASAAGGLYAVTRTVAVPASARSLRRDPRLTEVLAGRLGLPPARVRLFFERVSAPFSDNPVFYGNIAAGWYDGRAWRALRPAPEAEQALWRHRTLIWFAGSMLALLPLGWLFARRLGLPMLGFAAAAERLGGGAGSPDFPVSGPRELRLAGVALKQMQARLDAHFRERTAMIGAIAHDLRTPLARIAFRIEAADPMLRDDVQTDIAQMRAMIADTLAFVRGAAVSTRAELVDLGALMRVIGDKFTEIGEDVSMAGPPVRAVCLGDPIALERLFTNLIDNALRYGDAARLGVEVEGAIARVTVDDDGPGLRPNEIERVLEPFERGDPLHRRETDGVGLGLAIARSIAENHGGSLGLRNGATRGLVAECRLPLA